MRGGTGGWGGEITLDCKNVDTQQAFIMNDETQQRAIQTFPEENVLS